MADVADYEERLNLAVYAVLIELGQVLGAYIDNFVVVGGFCALALVSTR